MTTDPFATDEVRDRVLAAWAASPVRFREDANAEEDFALGGYRDRLVVELAQNAADAAVRAGVPGRLLLAVRELDGRAVLVAANTGAPLAASGVESLSTLRASDKRDEDAVGRFGVGFSAVLAVTDEPAVISRSGGVRFSAGDTRALVGQVAAHAPGLADELARRDGHVPVLRLPFPAEGSPPIGYDTAVLLPLRDAAAEDLVVRLLSEVGDPLLLALPALEEVVVELPSSPPRRVTDAASRWQVKRREGRLDPALLADRPTEERRRTGWSVTWAVPIDRTAALPGVLFAPTATDEPLTWPALLIATLPLDSGRRHVAPGPAADAIIASAAHAYADLLQDRAALGDAVWPLVPAGLPHGTVDAALRDEVRRILPGTPLLVPAEPHFGDDPGALLLRPRDAVALEPPVGADPSAVVGLASCVAGLVLAPRPAAAAFELLGVRRIGLADVVEQLPAQRSPDEWHRLYEALTPAAADPLTRETLAAIPVPLADGRTVRGARGLVLPPDDGGPATDPDDDAAGPAGALATLGVRVVHPDAVHPLLEQLGAVGVDPRTALDLPQVHAAVRAAADEDDADLADAVLTLVASAVATDRLAPGDLPWLADLVLPDADDDVAPADALALPDSFAAQTLDPRDVGLVAPDLVERWGADVLAAVGVLEGPTVLRSPDVPLTGAGPDDEPDEGPGPNDLDGFEDWAEQATRRALAAVGGSDGGRRDTAARSLIAADVTCAELVAVRDLDAVRDDAWPRVLARVAGEPQLRAAVLDPARLVVRGVHGVISQDVQPYTAWWLERALADGPWADPDADVVLARLLPPAPAVLADLDPALRRALGAVRTAADLGAAAVEAVLAGMADPDVEMDAAAAITLWRELADLADRAMSDGAGVAPPAWVRVLDGVGTRVVRGSEAVVVDAPAWLQRPDLGAPVIAPDPAACAALADLLDVALAADVALAKVEEDTAQITEVPPGVRALLPDGPVRWCEHEELLVDGVDVEWWVEGRGRDTVVHASTFDGLARGLAWAAGAWHRRASVAEVLTDPGALAATVVDESFA
jgi:hypothetical protein